MQVVTSLTNVLTFWLQKEKFKRTEANGTKKKKIWNYLGKGHGVKQWKSEVQC